MNHLAAVLSEFQFILTCVISVTRHYCYYLKVPLHHRCVEADPAVRAVGIFHLHGAGIVAGVAILGTASTLHHRLKTAQEIDAWRAQRILGQSAVRRDHQVHVVSVWWVCRLLRHFSDPVLGCSDRDLLPDADHAAGAGAGTSVNIDDSSTSFFC